ncbi:MAG: hypothetical protein IKF68_05385 [Erysipelotrichaceae bacterium]|nr:hypothetical protein [Erysipelotrichaceae bacterium]
MTDKELLNDHELLMELVEEKRRSEKTDKYKFYLIIAFLLALFVMVFVFLNRIYTTVASYGEVMGQVEQMADQVDAFIKESQGSLTQLNEALNKETIDQLKTVLDQLEKIGKIFGF